MPIEHREPTQATVKELYANAFRCASPGCLRPLYKVDSETGIRVRNSHISHICARRENGPRWDAAQSETENRSINNLLLLCLEHAQEIDQQNRADKFPPELLRKWKQHQLDDFDSLGKQGWALTSQMAQEAINASQDMSVTITNAVLNLGGESGKAPGAGGGGGGAIGANSRAGNGGNGGNTQYENSSQLLKNIPFKDFSNQPFGAGGGGAGTVGENAIGADGGDGGETVITGISAEQLKTYRIKEMKFSIGEGGEHGKKGGDTIVELVTVDDRTIPFIQAKGGSAGKPGFTLPVGSREVSEEDLKMGFGINWFVAEVLHFKNGLLYALGAGWEYWRANVPNDISWPIGCIASFGQISAPSKIVLFFIVENPNGEEFMRTPRVISNEPIRPIANVSFCHEMKFHADISGIWKLKVISGVFELGCISIEINC